MHRISQRLALFCGGLCLLFSLLLVLIGSVSSRYQLEQQFSQFHRHLAVDLANEVTPLVAQVDLIGLEATLRELQTRHGLQQIRVTDLESRPLGQAGGDVTVDSFHFSAPVTINRDLAAELSFTVTPGVAMEEQRGMSLGLIALAVLGGLCGAVLARQWGQRLERRLAGLRQRLSGDEPVEDELAALEAAVSALPLELIMPPAASDQRTASFEEAGLLYVQLHSLARYAETLDERSLLDFTEALRHLIDSVATLYGGSLSVAREFGLCVLFSGEHPAGSAGYRAAASGWLLLQLSRELSKQQRLNYTLGLACGLGEASADSGRDIYPSLYNQPIIDELSSLASTDAVAVSTSLQPDQDIQNRCQLREEERASFVESFTEPQADLLERQQQLLLSELSAPETRKS